MVIVLEVPFSLGELSSAPFPHVYASSLTVDGKSQTVLIRFEFGEMDENGTWNPTPIDTGRTVVLSGERLIPFFYTCPSVTDISLWDQVETLVYRELQATEPRLKGTITAIPASAESKDSPQQSLPFDDLLESLPISNLPKASL